MMSKKTRTTCILLLSILSTLFFISCNSSKEKTPDPNFHIYLSFGQSNMEGSAKIHPQDTISNERFQVLQPLDCEKSGRKKGNWYAAKPPLSNCYAGLSPADYFGKTMIKNLPDNIKIGIINVAVSGCDIRLFDKDIYQAHDSTYTEKWFTDKIKFYSGNPYQHLIDLAKIAQKDGVIKGILLHQGETNTGNKEWPAYVKKIYNHMTTDLSLDPTTTPLLAGEVVHADQNGICASMNEIIAALPETLPNSHVISSSGCEAQKDLIHFSSEGCRELGERYAQKMLSLLEK